MSLSMTLNDGSKIDTQLFRNRALKLLTLINAKPALDVLVAAKLPVKTAWKLARLLPKIDAELKAFDTARVSLAKEHGKLAEDGQQYLFETPEAIAAMNAGLDAIVQEDIDLACPKFKVEDLGDIEMTAGQLAALDFLLEE
jgi:hypothetical protein